MSAIAKVRVIEVTTPSGCTHLVAEDRFAAGCRSGCFVTVCKETVISGSLATEGRNRCDSCLREAAR